MMQHLLREFAPGYGGVERVAHSIANELGGTVFSLRFGKLSFDPLQVKYRRAHLKSFELGRLYLPLISRNLIDLVFSKKPLIAHLPCPTVLIIGLISRIINPKRFICFYWHSFIESKLSFTGILEIIYQFLALKIGIFFPVIVTSPVLQNTLISKGLCGKKIYILPCSLPDELEHLYAEISQNRKIKTSTIDTIIAICRLDSYKRVDWLIDAFSQTLAAKRLIILGDGPNRNGLELQAQNCIRTDQKVVFYGRVDEELKRRLLIEADLLVLPSDKSNEAFGIVQLEAMASGIPALAYHYRNSGMYWVSKLPSLEWSGRPNDLASLIQKLFTHPDLYKLACEESIIRYNHKFAITKWRKRLHEVLDNYPQINFVQSN